MIITIIRDFLDFSFRVVYIYDCVRFWTQCAVLAQSVARRLGKAEVGGSSPLGSSQKSPQFMRAFFADIFFRQNRKMPRPANLQFPGHLL